MSDEIKNAVIETATITVSEGLLDARLSLDYGDSGQVFGGFSLYLPKSFRHSTNQKNYAGYFIWRCMEIAGVTEWSDLEGKTIRARCDHSQVYAIGHIIGDDWFNPSDDFKAMKDETKATAAPETAATLDRLRKVNAELMAALKAAAGYLTNAAIDLKTGAPKKAALMTINGGLNDTCAAIARATGGTEGV